MTKLSKLDTVRMSLSDANHNELATVMSSTDLQELLTKRQALLEDKASAIKIALQKIDDEFDFKLNLIEHEYSSILILLSR